MFLRLAVDLHKLPMSDPLPASNLEFECPLCGGAFEVAAEWLGHEVECPHCQAGVLLEAEDSVADGPGPPPPTKTNQQASDERPVDSLPESSTAEVVAPVAQEEPPEQTTPSSPRPELTRQQKAALRRRFNAILATLGVLLLVGAFVLLSRIAQ